MRVLRVDRLPDDPVAAAAAFYARLDSIPDREGDHSSDSLAPGLVEAAPLTLMFAPADHTHRAWRLAAVQGLARAAAPRRVNAIASDDEGAIAAALRYLERAPGVTGQMLALDGTGAAPMLS